MICPGGSIERMNPNILKSNLQLTMKTTTTNPPMIPSAQSASARPKVPFQWRALTSVVITFSFAVLALSGVVLAFAPPGRVANWTDWTMLTMRKSQWGNIHTWFGLMFVIAGMIHLVLNWRPLLGYFKSKLTRHYSFRREWVLGVALFAAIFVGTRMEVPPFSTVLSLTESVRLGWEKAEEQPPIPHAELFTLRELAEKEGLPLEPALARLEVWGLKGVVPEIRLAQLGKINRRPARELYHLMIGSTGAGQGVGRGLAGGGPGRKTLAEFCSGEGLDLKTVQARLEAGGIRVEPGFTLRELAVENGYEKPYELLQIMQGEE